MAEQDKKKKKIVHFQLHEKQAEVFNNDSRFRVVVAGRRFGKTKLSMLEMLAWATKKCQKIWYVAPTYRMAKQIMWNDLKVSVPLEWVTKIRENELSMEFRNGSKIELRGADKPDSLRGVSLDFLVLDEFQDIDPETWKTVLRPTLADRKGHALFIGCVKGDTRVLSDQGLKNIEEFCTNKKPKSLTPIDVNLYGLDKKVNKADNFWNNGVVKTKKIRTAMGFELEASLIHPVWIMSEDHREGFEKMENLKVGTRIAIDRGMEMWGNKSILNGWPERLGKLVSTYRHLKWCDAYRVPKITENANLFYFLGAYLMNGEINEKTSKLYLTMKDVGIFHYFGERTFDIPFVQEKVGSYRWFVESRGAVEFIKFLKLDEDQRLGRLPRWLWNCPRNLVGAFLSGVWDASASVSAKINLTYLSSDRHELIKDIQLLLTNFGIISKRSKLEDGRSQILIRGYNAEMFKDIVQLRSKAKAENIDIFVFSNFYVDTVPCIHALERLRKAVRKHYYYTLLVQFISAIKRGRRHEVSYYGLQNILDDERRYRGETEEFKAIEKTIERHYYWDTIESIEDGECQTYDFTVPESHSFWSNGFISHNTPKGFNELYKLYKLGQNKVRQMRKQWHSWQFPTITSPFIPKAEIDAARKDMDEKSFRQEFCHLPDTKVLKWDGAISPIKDLKPNDILAYIDDKGKRKPCSVIDKRETGVKDIVEAVLETGDTFKASSNHKLSLFDGEKFVEQTLDSANWIEKSPILYVPTSDEEKIAALVGYCTGDGNVCQKAERYTKKDGSVSEYSRIKASFFGNDKTDIEWIRQDLVDLGWIEKATVNPKKNKVGAKTPYTYQIQLSDSATKKLVAFGAPVGKKTAQEFRVPDWVKFGSNSVKRAYLSALFGAEGAMPNTKSVKSYVGRLPVLSMSKIKGNDGLSFFEDLKALAFDLGVKCNVTQTETNKYGKTFVNYWLRVQTESALDFYNNVSYAYCNSKAEEGWKLAQYIKAYRYAGKRKTEIIKSMRAEGASFYKIGKALGIGTGGIYNLWQRIEKGEECNAGHRFDKYDKWIEKRWNQKLGLLKIEIVEKRNLKPTAVFNITVDSPDHSYLLADGTNNFNCASFESMSGRVYYAFDRKEHIANVEFNPKLPIWVGMDFNIDPMSTVIFQPQPNGQVWAIDEIVQVSSNTDDICAELEKRYYKYQNQVTIYPDPAGSARQHARGESDLDIIREHGFKRIKVRRQHSAVADRVNAVNRLLKTASGEIRLYINPRCKHLIDSFEQTLYIPGSRDVDKSLGVEHSADAAGYCIELEFPLRKFVPAGFSR